MKKTLGFTLIEVMIVIVIIAIMGILLFGHLFKSREITIRVPGNHPPIEQTIEKKNPNFQGDY